MYMDSPIYQMHQRHFYTGYYLGLGNEDFYELLFQKEFEQTNRTNILTVYVGKA